MPGTWSGLLRWVDAPAPRPRHGGRGHSAVATLIGVQGPVMRAAKPLDIEGPAIIRVMRFGLGSATHLAWAPFQKAEA